MGYEILNGHKAGRMVDFGFGKLRLWSAGGSLGSPIHSRNIDHDVIMIPNEIHDMARYSSWMILFNAADVYFDRHLDQRSAPAP